LLLPSFHLGCLSLFLSPFHLWRLSPFSLWLWLANREIGITVIIIPSFETAVCIAVIVPGICIPLRCFCRAKDPAVTIPGSRSGVLIPSCIRLSRESGIPGILIPSLETAVCIAIIISGVCVPVRRFCRPEYSSIPVAGSGTVVIIPPGFRLARGIGITGIHVPSFKAAIVIGTVIIPGTACLAVIIIIFPETTCVIPVIAFHIAGRKTPVIITAYIGAVNTYLVVPEIRTPRAVRFTETDRVDRTTISFCIITARARTETIIIAVTEIIDDNRRVINDGNILPAIDTVIVNTG